MDTLCVLCASLCALCVGLAFADEVQTVKEGPDWVATEYLRDIVPGSALDFSALGIHDAPAGKYGWLVSRNGHAEFENRPDVPARFYGVNLCNSANYLTDDEIEQVTDRLVRLGYNAVRFHHHDDAWAAAHARRGNDGALRANDVGALRQMTNDGNLVIAAEGGSSLRGKAAHVIAGVAGSVIDGDDAIDRLDALIAACIRKGIYLTTDLYVSRKCAWRELGIERDGEADPMSVKLLMMVTEAGFDNWKRFARAFLTHVNPYTGRCLAEEPAMPLLVLINESSPHSFWNQAKAIPEFKALWPQWLEGVRAEDPAAFPAASPEAFPETGGWWDPSPESSAKAAFWAWCCGRFSKRAAAFLRDELGVRAMISTENNGPVLPEILRMRAGGDYVDYHFYVCESSAATQAAREETGLPLKFMFQNHNALQERAGRYGMAAFSRVWGRPFVVSESQTTGPNFNRAMSGPAIGALAAVQDWTGLWTFALAHTREKLFDGVDAAPGRYDLSLDPLMQATDRLPMLLFLRGDQAMPKAAFANSFPDDVMRADAEGRVSLASRPEWAGDGLEWRARLGVSFEDDGRDVSTKRPQGDGGRAVGASLPEDVEAERWGEPPALPYAPPSGVSVDGEKGEIVIEGPRTCAGFIHDGGSFEAGALSATARGHSALVAVSALNGACLADASRILVWHLTDLHGEGFSWGGDIVKSQYWPHKGMLDWGTSRLMLHTGEADIGLVLPVGTEAQPPSFAVFALDTAGKRRAKVPATYNPAIGLLRFTASSRQPFGGCLYYEIVRQP